MEIQIPWFLMLWIFYKIYEEYQILIFLNCRFKSTNIVQKLTIIKSQKL